MLCRFRFGDTYTESPYKAKLILVSPNFPNDTQNGKKENLFCVNNGKVYFSSFFSENMDVIYHVWHKVGDKRKIMKISFKAESTRNCVSSIDVDNSMDGNWKVVVYDQDGRHIDGREFIIEGGKVFVLHFPRSKYRSRSTICSAIGEDGEPIDKEENLSIRFNQIYFLNRYNETLPETDVTHMWYRDDKLYERKETKRMKDKLITYSNITLPDKPLGYWKVVSFDSAWQYIDYFDFTIERIG